MLSLRELCLPGPPLRQPFHWAQLENGLIDRLGSVEEIRQETLVHFQMSLVFKRIAALVTGCKHPPNRRSQAESMVQGLEDNIAVVRPIALPAQGRERQRMCRVVGEV